MKDPIDVSEEMSSEEAPGLVSLIHGRLKEAEDGRQIHEQRWLTAYKNFRGIYDSTTQYTSTEKSKVFIKITKTKVLAAYGQIVDILFANKKFPLTVESTPVPEGVAEFAHLKTPLDDMLTSSVGYEGDGRELPPGATEASEGMDYLGGLAKEYEGASLAEGMSKTGELQISPAAETARRMEKIIHDQLTPSCYIGYRHLRNIGWKPEFPILMNAIIQTYDDPTNDTSKQDAIQLAGMMSNIEKVENLYIGKAI